MALSPILWICARLPILSNLELVVYLIQCIIVIDFKLMSFSPCRTPGHQPSCWYHNAIDLKKKSLSNPCRTPRYHSLRCSARPKYCAAESVDLNKGRSPAKKKCILSGFARLGLVWGEGGGGLAKLFGTFSGSAFLVNKRSPFLPK